MKLRPPAKKREAVANSKPENYRKARLALGLYVRRGVYPKWSRLDITTNFRWTADTIEGVYANVWGELRAMLTESNLAYPPIAKTTMELVRKHYGISPRDLVSGYRRQVIVEGRCIAACCMFKAGLSKHAIARAMQKDEQTIRHAISSRIHYLEGLPNVPNSWNGGPPSDGQAS